MKKEICQDCEETKANKQCTLCEQYYCEDCHLDHLPDCEYAEDAFKDVDE